MAKVVVHPVIFSKVGVDVEGRRWWARGDGWKGGAGDGGGWTVGEEVVVVVIGEEVMVWRRGG